MARVTVEDCVLQIPNRFELVMLAAHRARGLGSGAELKVGRDRDKNPVVSLREIAEQKLDLGSLEESLIKGLQKRIEPERPEEEIVEMLSSEQQAWANALDTGMDTAEDSEEDAEGDDSIGLEAEGEGDENVQETFEDANIKD